MRKDSQHWGTIILLSFLMCINSYAFIVENFVQSAIDEESEQYSFITSADLDNDGVEEIIVSIFPSIWPGKKSNGKVVIYKTDRTLSSWTRDVILDVDAKVKYPNHVSAYDIDSDGDLDLIVPYGFLACTSACGGLLWMENTPNGWIRHDIVKNGNPLFYHQVELADLNRDGVLDMVTTAESMDRSGNSSAQVEVFYGDRSIDYFSHQPVVLGDGGGSFPTVRDMDGDGDLDIASAQYFKKGADAVWFEQNEGEWIKHVISTDLGPSIQLSFIENFYGEGKPMVLLSNHANIMDNPQGPESGLFELLAPQDPTQLWDYRKISDEIISKKSVLIFFQAAPGIFKWGDLDGDGDLDILLSGDGSPKVYVLEQQTDKSFIQKVLIEDFPQAGVHVADLNKDGVNEIVIGSYEKKQLILFQDLKSSIAR